MTYTFLLLDIALLVLPFCFALDRKIFNIEIIRSALVPSLIVTVLFSEIAVFFTASKVWNFNPAYLLGSYYRALPIEGCLFIFAFSFSGLAIYNYLNLKFPKNDLQKYSLAISNLMLGICVAILFFAHAQWFPIVTVGLSFILLLSIEYLNKLRFMYRFYRAFLVCLIPFYVCYGIICNLPIISYNQNETMDVNLGKIPFENHFYVLSMLLLGVYLVEFFKNRTAK